MPALDNAQYERFAQALSIGANQTQAAISAGFSAKSAAYQGCRLAKNAAIAARVNELKTRAAERAVEQSKQQGIRAIVDEAWIKAILQDNAIKGQQTGDLSASNRAAELLARLQGLMVERSEVADLRESGIAERLAAARQRIGKANVVEMPKGEDQAKTG